MATRRVVTLLWIVLVIGLIGLSSTLTRAQGAPPTDEGPRAEMDRAAAEASVAGAIPVQGSLTDAAGVPLDGVYSLTFRLYDTSEGGLALCSDIDSVEVTGGLFFGYLDSCSADDINGRPLYFAIQVGSGPEMTPRQPIYPVPYAYSLKPGAIISATMVNGATFDVWNYGDRGRGLRSYAMAETGTNYGIVGASRSPDGYGGYFYNNGGGVGLWAAGGIGIKANASSDGVDLMLAGTEDSAAGDDGIVASDSAYASSDLLLRSNDAVRVDLDNDGSGEDADFEIYDRSDTRIFSVDESGAVTYGGPGIAAFPRPAYDSGWVTIAAGFANALTFSHNLGGDENDYVVDLSLKGPAGVGIHGFGFGGDTTAGGLYGAWWRNLTSASIIVERGLNDTDVTQVRVRIWIYN